MPGMAAPPVSPTAPRIAVAGDPCFDVVGLAVPPSPAGSGAPIDNWRLTGETRTHFLPGGSLLMEDFVKATGAGAVCGPRFERPAALADSPGGKGPLTSAELLRLAERLTRDEMVHSLLSLDWFPEKPKSAERRIRVQHTHGFSGPKAPDSSLGVLPPKSPDGTAGVVVLDDTGNQFRRSPSQWPVEITSATARPLVIHKLHRPLPYPTVGGNPLWARLRDVHADQHVVIVSVDDLRSANAPISRGLSWERTALDLVWQLQNVDTFAALRDCRHLIVRLGIDGAVYWTSTGSGDSTSYAAWLTYDPSGIEGSGEQSRQGRMVGYGSAFVAGLAQTLAASGLTEQSIQEGIAAGLTASRRLLHAGFGSMDTTGGGPRYPGGELFAAEGHSHHFACQPIPIVPGAIAPDRGYWRLLDSVFSGKTGDLHRAVALTATGAAPGELEKTAAALLRQAPVAAFGKGLRTYDRREIEDYRALYSLMRDYVSQPRAPRPLNVAVFGPPGAGKSFGVKMVAKELETLGDLRAIKTLTFNLSQYQTADELSAAFHLVRDCGLRGEMPLVFFDEFDTGLSGVPLGWLRYFLSPMQDAEFLDRGAPHPIGQAIFVFAGGTCRSYAEFARPLETGDPEFKKAKGPDFLSRLRATLDIPGLDLEPAFDAYGPVEAFPNEAAILLRRANILAFQLGEKAPHLRGAGKALRVSEPVLRALLHLPQFAHGNRSFEALLDMSHLHDETVFVPSMLPASGHTDLHANAAHLSQLLATTYPFSVDDRDKIAAEIHLHYLEVRKAKNEFKLDKPSHNDWEHLDDRYRDSNRRQADDIPRKIRLTGRWFRKGRVKEPTAPMFTDAAEVDRYARLEHDRWVAGMRRAGFVWGLAEDIGLRMHPCVVPWEDRRLNEAEKDKDRDAIQAIPRYLAAAGYEVIDPS